MIKNPIRLLQYVVAGWIPGGRRRCVMCGHAVWRFMPYQGGAALASPLMSALQVVGSDRRNFECPRCGSHDRERHLRMYMEASGLLAYLHNKAVLHFAPEKRLTRLIHETGPARYIRCDLHPQAPDVQKVDILDMTFESESFDLLVANHVLEHVDDDIKALTEIYRVLKVGGIAILQTPYSRKLHLTWQDAGIDNEDARVQAYGQADHVRLYGRDIFDRVASVGLLPEIRTHADLLPGISAATFGVNWDEPYFLFKKTG